jgi:hypothetical protein
VILRIPSDIRNVRVGVQELMNVVPFLIGKYPLNRSPLKAELAGRDSEQPGKGGIILVVNINVESIDSASETFV